jgi:hypothetical protein
LSNTGSAENYNDASTYNPNQKKYVLGTCTVIRNLELYKIARKTNSFKRKYKSSATDGIPIGAMYHKVQ